jgi:hypothetical protein
MRGDFTRNSFRPERHYHGVLKQQGRVDLDADWNEQGAITAHRIETGTADIVGHAGAPEGDPGFLITAASGGTSLNISKGRAYVDGVLCQNEQGVLITAQPDLPGFQLPTTAGSYIAYLDVWQRHITALDDPDIREVALGGPDTCTRARTVWQVKLLQGPPPNQGTPLDCGTSVSAYDQLVAGSTGTLMAQAQPGSNMTDPCCIPASAGYRSLENQLYRVEIHAGGDIAGGGVTFKWSRDNGTVVTSWLAQAGQDLSVASVGPDSVLGFAAGLWVELIDDTIELNLQPGAQVKPGTLVRIASVQGLTITVDQNTATGSIVYTDFPRNPKIRRWDSAGAVTAAAGGWVNLENGVQVQFGSGSYRPGDYWLIPARTLTGQIEWPVDSTSKPRALPPLGIRHNYCRLAVVNFDGKIWSVAQSCLRIFAPLPSPPPKAIHVTAVKYYSVATNNSYIDLPNDSSILISSVTSPATVNPLNGVGVMSLQFQVYCDAPIDPVSVEQATCFVSTELPVPGQSVGVPMGFQPLVLPGQVSVTNTATTGRIDLTVPLSSTAALGALIQNNLMVKWLMRLQLKGAFLFGLDPSLHVDGQARGFTRRDADGPHVGLRLPSGSEECASDFETWFWLTKPVTLAVSFSPGSIYAGTVGQGTVTLNVAAPPGGAVITLAPTGNFGTVPPTVTLPEGQSTAAFQVTNTSPGTLQVTASYAGSSGSGALQINVVPTLQSLTFNPNPMASSQDSSVGTLTLTAPAAPGGATVSLSYVNPPGASQLTNGPASVSIPAGQTSATFTVTRASPSTTFTNSPPLTVTVTATNPGHVQAGLILAFPKLT